MELKALDPDPARTLERALALGAEDRGVIVQRDTYFRVAARPAEAARGGAGRGPPDRLRAAGRRRGARVELPRRARPRPGGAARRARRRRTASTSWWRSGGGCCCGRRSASTSTRSTGLGSFVELEAVAAPDSDLARERAQVAHLRGALAIGDDALREGSYADAVRGRAPDPELLALAREAAGRAYAPYSDFPVGAAVRTADGRRYAGANVENAAYPQGQCAEASALGAMVAGGGGRVVEVVVAAPSARAVRALRRLPPAAARVRRPGRADPPRRHERVRRTTSLAELLPLSFGPESLG